MRPFSMWDVRGERYLRQEEVVCGYGGRVRVYVGGGDVDGGCCALRLTNHRGLVDVFFRCNECRGWSKHRCIDNRIVGEFVWWSVELCKNPLCAAGRAL